MACRRGRYRKVGNMDGGANPAGTQCELPPSAAFNFCPDVRVHPGAPILGYIQVPRC
jgi:hypothetical protein